MFSIEPTYQLILPPTDETHLLLVGVGGTGSWLALSLARLVYHARQKGLDTSLTLIDPDVVEIRNIGRQSFSTGDLGYNKAITMAARLNAAFGLDVQAFPQAFTPDKAYLRIKRNSHSVLTLVIGAVDNHLARRQIATTLYTRETNSRRAAYWLDCGNANHNGQVLIGNAFYREQINVDENLRLIQGLPAPSIQEPGLLEPDDHEETLSCADLTLRDEQSLMVNLQVAAIASQYTAEFVLQRRITSYATYFTLEPPTTQSKPLTATAVAHWLDTIPALSP